MSECKRQVIRFDGIEGPCNYPLPCWRHPEARPQAWDDPAGRIRELEAELHRLREAIPISVEWGVLGEAFSPQSSREAAERTVKRLTTGKYRVTTRRVAYRLVSEPRVIEDDVQ